MGLQRVGYDRLTQGLCMSIEKAAMMKRKSNIDPEHSILPLFSDTFFFVRTALKLIQRSRLCYHAAAQVEEASILEVKPSVSKDLLDI